MFQFIYYIPEQCSEARCVLVFVSSRRIVASAKVVFSEYVRNRNLTIGAVQMPFQKDSEYTYIVGILTYIL